jgi:hypothetical protein
MKKVLDGILEGLVNQFGLPDFLFSSTMSLRCSVVSERLFFVLKNACVGNSTPDADLRSHRNAKELVGRNLHKATR